MLTKDQFRKRYREHNPTLHVAHDGDMGCSTFGYAKPLEPGRVYLLGDFHECANGGWAREVIARLAERGTPEQTAQWASDALAGE